MRAAYMQRVGSVRQDAIACPRDTYYRTLPVALDLGLGSAGNNSRALLTSGSGLGLRVLKAIESSAQQLPMPGQSLDEIYF